MLLVLQNPCQCFAVYSNRINTLLNFVVINAIFLYLIGEFTDTPTLCRYLLRENCKFGNLLFVLVGPYASRLPETYEVLSL